MKTIFAGYIIIFLSFTIHAQIITTIAGTGTPTYSGDGGPANLACIDYPTHITIDNSGNLFFGDYTNCCIRKINASGIITTITGIGSYGYSGDGGPATAAANSGPAGVAVDGSGNIYFCDYNNSRIRKINTSGIITTIAGNGFAGFTGDGGPASSAQINTPWGIALDTSGNIYFSDRFNYRIRKINTSGIISTIGGNGISGFSGDSGPATDAELDQPVDIYVDIYNNLYFSDFFNQRIRKINTTGIISTIAGNGISGYSVDGVPATSTEIYTPIGVAVDTAGNLYIGDYGNNRIRKVNTSGIITTIAGNGTLGYSGDGGPATSAQLNGPYGVTVAASGNIYISDAFNYRVRMISTENHPPVFTGGDVQSLNVCISEADPAVPINSLLAVIDSDSGQTETWSLVTPPSHGVAVASYTTTSTGGMLTPSGLTYTPASGYTGADMFTISVTDGFASDTTTINITVNPAPNAGVIMGTDSICPGQTTALTESASGGIWSNSNDSISSVNSSGIATGIYPGSDTIIYTVISSCGIVSAIFPFDVQTFTECRTGLNMIISENNAGIKIYPNPNNGFFEVSLVANIDEQARFIITNNTGGKISEFINRTNETENIKLNIPAGIYFISAVTNHGIYNGKIAIE